MPAAAPNMPPSNEDMKPPPPPPPMPPPHPAATPSTAKSPDQGKHQPQPHKNNQADADVAHDPVSKADGLTDPARRGGNVGGECRFDESSALHQGLVRFVRLEVILQDAIKLIQGTPRKDLLRFIAYPSLELWWVFADQNINPVDVQFLKTLPGPLLEKGLLFASFLRNRATLLRNRAEGLDHDVAVVRAFNAVQDFLCLLDRGGIEKLGLIPDFGRGGMHGWNQQTHGQNGSQQRDSG